MKLSIITVCKNAELAIEKTIVSVLNQTFNDFEYIIVDGASSDKTMETIGKYSNSINKMTSEPDNGIYDAMNKGIDLSSGEYLMFLNAGDYLINPNVLKRIFDYPLKGEIIYGNGLIELPNGFLFRRTFPKKITESFMFFDTIPHQDSLTKRDVFHNVGGFDDSYIIAGDYEFFLKAIFKLNYQTQFIPEYIAVNDLTGLSRQKKYKILAKTERKKSAKLYFSATNFYLYQTIKPFYLLFLKYPKYFFNLINSIIRNERDL